MTEYNEMNFDAEEMPEPQENGIAEAAEMPESQEACAVEAEEMQKDPARKAGHLLMKASHMMKRAHHANHAQQHGGFDPEQGQGRVISLLQKTGPMKQSELVYLLGVRQQSLAETLGKLENLGLIQRERSEDDRRTWLVSLTDAGKAAQLNQHEPADALAGFSDEEIKQFSEYLKRVIKNLESQVGNDPCCHGRGHGHKHGHGPGCGDRPRGPHGHGCDDRPRGPHGPHGCDDRPRGPHGPHGCDDRPRGPHGPHGCGDRLRGPHGPRDFQHEDHRPW